MNRAGHATDERAPRHSTGRHAPVPDYMAIARTPEFVELRNRRRRFVFPMAAVFLGWYLTYVLLISYAAPLMARPVVGLINVGLALAIAQFGTTILITLAYLVYARRRIDPQIEVVQEAAGERS